MKETIHLANPGDQDWTSHRYILSFGPYGDTRLMAYANSLDDALEACADWLADNAPGVFLDDSVVEESYREALAAGKTEGQAWDEALIDVTVLDQGRYLLSYEWCATGPVSRQDIREMREGGLTFEFTTTA